MYRDYMIGLGKSYQFYDKEEIQKMTYRLILEGSLKIYRKLEIRTIKELICTIFNYLNYEKQKSIIIFSDNEEECTRLDGCSYINELIDELCLTDVSLDQTIEEYAKKVKKGKMNFYIEMSRKEFISILEQHVEEEYGV